MIFFPASREREKLDKVAIDALDLKSKISILMGRSQLQLAYAETPRERPFSQRRVALAWLASFSLPPTSKHQDEQFFAVTADNRMGRVRKLGNELISLRFEEQPLSLEAAYTRQMGSDGTTLGKLLHQEVDARLLAIGINIKTTGEKREAEGSVSMEAISFAQAPLQLDVPPEFLAA